MWQEIINAVSAEMLVEQYGFHPIRHRIVCPFHDDHHPSLTLYPGNRGWWCFTCGSGGSIIDFVAKYFDLSPLDAAKKINDDFHLGIIGEKPSCMARQKARHQQLMAQQKQKQLQEGEMALIREFRRRYHIAPPPANTPPNSPLWGQYAANLGRLDYLEWRLDFGIPLHKRGL